MDIISYVLSKKYTKDTVIGLGAIKGANCTIQNVVHANGKTTITFQWTANDDTIQTTQIEVLDGTPIYTWTSGESYNINDIVIYNSVFYICTIANSDIVFNQAKWNPIGSADSNFGIIENSTLLPSGLSSTDRKLYFSIEDGYFWLWDGTTWIVELEIDDRLQFGSSMPTSPINGQTFLYMGTSTYTYDVVTPIGTENPRLEGWYVENGVGNYQLTTDTTVQNGTIYYEKNDQYIKGVIYVYNSTTLRWIAQESGDIMIPISNIEIDALFD